jgi:nicotinamide riboside kinase
MKKIKIVLIGTLSVGKTSVFNILKRKYNNNKNFAFVREAARDFINKYKLKDRSSIKIQKEIQDLIWNREKSAYKTNAKIIICDRSVIDPVVYSRFYGKLKESKILFKRIEQWLKSYSNTKFLLFDILNWRFAPDKTRFENEEKRIKIHKEYVRFLNENKLPFILITGSLKQRVEQTNKIIKRFLPTTSSSTASTSGEPATR